MKFSTKKFGSIATAAVLAGTMAFMPATAFATDPVNYVTNQQIVKTYNYGNTPYAPQTFTFSLAYDASKTPEPVGSNTPEAPTTVAGADQKAIVNATDTDPNDTNKVETGNASLLDLVKEYQFSKPGKYYFTLSEVNKDNPNIDYDDTTYTVRVDVVWADAANPQGNVTINGLAVFKNDKNGVAGKDKESAAAFTNGSNASDGNLIVSKKVSGTAANTDDYFKYTLQLTDTSQVSGDYVVKKTGTNEVVKTLSKDNDYTVDFYLKHNESVYVVGLPKNAAYKVTESEKVVTGTGANMAEGTDDNGYTETYKVNGAETATTGTVVNGAINATGDTTVAYTNDKGFATNTGITMNTLPFAVVATVAVAGGAALVISRRRHAGEDF